MDRHGFAVLSDHICSTSNPVAVHKPELSRAIVSILEKNFCFHTEFLCFIVYWWLKRDDRVLRPS
jgi:hypothetical protein